MVWNCGDNNQDKDWKTNCFSEQNKNNSQQQVENKKFHTFVMSHLTTQN